MEPHSEERVEKERVSSSPDSGISVLDPDDSTEAQKRKSELGRRKELTEASVYQHTHAQNNTMANSLNPFSFKYQSADSRKWAYLKSLSQDSEYSLDDTLFDAEGILSELGFAGTRYPTIPERFLPSLMQRLSKFPESEMQTLNDRIVHSIGCFKRKEGKRRLFRNLSTGKDPLMGVSNQNSLSCPSAANYPLLRSNTGPAAFTYDDIPPGTTANNSLKAGNADEELSSQDNEDSFPQSPIAILVSQPSVDVNSNCSGSDNATHIDNVSELDNAEIQQSVADILSSNEGNDFVSSDVKVEVNAIQDNNTSFTKTTANSNEEQVSSVSWNSSFSDSSHSLTSEDAQLNYESCAFAVSKIAVKNPSVESEIHNIQKRARKAPLRRSSSLQINENISKMSDTLKNSALTGLPIKSEITSNSTSAGPIEVSNFLPSTDEHSVKSSTQGRCSEKSLNKTMDDSKPHHERTAPMSGKFQYSRTSSLTNFLTSMLNEDEGGRRSKSSNSDEKALHPKNDIGLYENQVPTSQNIQQVQMEISSDSKNVEIYKSSMLATSCEVEDTEINSFKGRALRRMSWSSQRTHSFEVVDSESEENVNSQYSVVNDVPLVEEVKLDSESPKSLLTHGQEEIISVSRTSLPEPVNVSNAENFCRVAGRKDEMIPTTRARCTQSLKKQKNSLKRPRIMSCPFPKDFLSSCKISAEASLTDDLRTVESHRNFHAVTTDKKRPSRVNVSKRIKELQNKFSKSSSVPSACTPSFTKKHSFDELQRPPRSLSPSPAPTSIVSTNDFFPSRASFEKSIDNAWCMTADQRTFSENSFSEEEYRLTDFQENESCEVMLQANQSLSRTSAPFKKSLPNKISTKCKRNQQVDDCSQTSDLNFCDLSSCCSSTCDDNDKELSSIATTYIKDSEQLLQTPSSFLRNGKLVSCSTGDCAENNVSFSPTVRKVSAAENSSSENYHSIHSRSSSTNNVVISALEEYPSKTTSAKSAPASGFDSCEADPELSQNRRVSRLKFSKLIPLQNGKDTDAKENTSNSNTSQAQACRATKQEAMLEKKIRAFSKLLAKLGNTEAGAGACLKTMDDATGTLNVSKDKRYSMSARKCVTPPPEFDRLLFLLKTFDLKRKDVETSPVYRNEVFMVLDDEGLANPTHFSASVTMDINENEAEKARGKSHRENEQESNQRIQKIMHDATGRTEDSKAQLPFKEVSKDLEELQMSIQKAKETRISASRELHFLQELLSGDSADDLHDRKMKRNKSRKNDQKSSINVPDTGFQEDETTVPRKTALSDLREKSKKDVLEDTDFWREEMKKVKEENDRVWQERLNRMEERLRNQEQELIQAQSENEALQRRLELQRLSSSPYHCKTDLQNGHGRADSAFEDDEECGNHKPSTPTHSTRQDCERLQEQLMKTEQRADELNLLLNQKLIELNKLQLTLSKQTKEMIELEKSYVQLQCRFRRGASKPVVSRLCSRSSPFASKNLFQKPSPPASPGPTSICP